MSDTRTLQARPPAERPLSPHLQIYRPMLTMMMSIVHRITGFGLYFGTLLLAWWLNSAQGPNGYGKFQAFAGSWVGRLILFGYTWALIHHALGGIRYLIWDSGRGFRPRRARVARRRQPYRLDRPHGDPVDRWPLRSSEVRNDRAQAYPDTARARARVRLGKVGHR